MRTFRREFGGRSAVGLVEVVISATILLLLTSAMIEAVQQVGAVGRTGSIEGRIQLATQDVLESVTQDLKAAGYTSANGRTYPYVFDHGVAEAPFAAHSHEPAVEHAQADEPDFGDDREIVFVRPAFAEVAQDVDGNNWDLYDENGDPIALPEVDVVKRYPFPAIDGSGAASFQAQEISYVLVTAADGVNELQRRRDGVLHKVIARGVERVVFDTQDTDPIGVSIGSVRVRLWLRLRDEKGTVHRRFAETVVRLQNGVDS